MARGKSNMSQKANMKFIRDQKFNQDIKGENWRFYESRFFTTSPFGRNSLKTVPVEITKFLFEIKTLHDDQIYITNQLIFNMIVPLKFIYKSNKLSHYT